MYFTIYYSKFCLKQAVFYILAGQTLLEVNSRLVIFAKLIGSNHRKLILTDTISIIRLTGGPD